MIMIILAWWFCAARRGVGTNINRCSASWRVSVWLCEMEPDQPSEAVPEVQQRFDRDLNLMQAALDAATSSPQVPRLASITCAPAIHSTQTFAFSWATDAAAEISPSQQQARFVRNCIGGARHNEQLFSGIHKKKWVHSEDRIAALWVWVWIAESLNC